MVHIVYVPYWCSHNSNSILCKYPIKPQFLPNYATKIWIRWALTYCVNRWITQVSINLFCHHRLFWFFLSVFDRALEIWIKGAEDAHAQNNQLSSHTHVGSSLPCSKLMPKLELNLFASMGNLPICVWPILLGWWGWGNPSGNHSSSGTTTIATISKVSIPWINLLFMLSFFLSYHTGIMFPVWSCFVSVFTKSNCTWQTECSLHSILNVSSNSWVRWSGKNVSYVTMQLVSVCAVINLTKPFILTRRIYGSYWALLVISAVISG